MARMTLEEKLAAVARAETRDALIGWLGDGANVVVALAAEIMGRSGDEAFIAPLTETFLRLVAHQQPATVDKLCRAKEAIALALDALRCGDPEPYLRGMRHVQMEPVYGGHADVAATLRAHCATALARMHYAEAHFALAPLLVDPEKQPRLAAIKALTYLVGERSELLLRLKILTGDAEPEVLSECMAGLLTLEPERSLPFIADFLDAPERQTVELAALTLGHSRHAEAFPLLRARWERNSDLDLRKALLLALALTRTEEAFDYLLIIMQNEAETTAIYACDALALYGVDRRYRERMATVIAARRNSRLADAFTEHFPPAP